MKSVALRLIALPVFLLITGHLCFAQIPPVKTDTLHPAQGGAGAAGCSLTGPSSCAEAAAKITPSPIASQGRGMTNGGAAQSPQPTCFV